LAFEAFHGMEEIVSSSRVPQAGRVCFLILNLCPDCAWRCRLWRFERFCRFV